MKYLYNQQCLKSVASMAVLCSALVSTSTQAGYLQNFNEPNSVQLVNALQNKNLHIVQLGDSHTAGDSLTEAMRTSLQQQLGNGGMGWAMPMYFSGQRMARFGYDHHAFQPISSRNNHQENYTLGGLIAKPLQQGSTLTLKAKRGDEVEQNIRLSLRQAQGDGKFIARDATGKVFNIEAPSKNNTWQLVQFKAKLPVTIQAQNVTQSAIGGWWAFNAKNTGATVSALGINGAELSHLNRWNNQAWKNELAQINPQLVILAYGTNEAYNNVSPEKVRSVLTQRIQQIRSTSPQTAIMILSAPEALKSINGQCGVRPTQLTAIQQVQKQVAQSQNTLYWDWQQAMGGQCSMKSWINQGKASKDGVHFTVKGYTQLGQDLAQDILALNSLKLNMSEPPTMQSWVNSNMQQAQDVAILPTKHTDGTGQDRQQPIGQTPTPIELPHFNPNGLARICTEDEQGQQQCQTTPAKNMY
ncbi:GDSL-type esterase/lipase family protein [Moraxella sp. ZY210820]|uniref:GDSL-type esterase/lipase family protein n=1 Tax=Moraxella sp. ZY210820 TaxID=2904123 RepID=UPI00272F0429|nr:GDSL-type esterase/lipase family protein [Moraxella sp. ZY210820]WLF84743.1 GDSL-type esterase/lipase family protein [Moraxella sp. ZY210820]